MGAHPADGTGDQAQRDAFGMVLSEWNTLRLIDVVIASSGAIERRVMTTLVRFDPFRLARDLDTRLRVDRAAWLPRVDLVDQETGWLVRVETPGMDPEAVDVEVEGNTLTISGSRSFTNEENDDSYLRKEIFEGTFRRTIRLPESAEASEISASSRDGLLEIVVPRKPEELPKRVQIEVSTT